MVPYPVAWTIDYQKTKMIQLQQIEEGEIEEVIEMRDGREKALNGK
jgi:hypothetical protein